MVPFTSAGISASVTHGAKAIGDMQFLHVVDDLVGGSDRHPEVWLGFSAKYGGGIEMPFAGTRSR
jgi:hypothetical protein